MLLLCDLGSACWTEQKRKRLEKEREDAEAEEEGQQIRDTDEQLD